MGFQVLSQVLVRAPLLPARELGRAAQALQAHELGESALLLASPDLVGGLERAGPRAQAALLRYARRAAFRPTPSGLLAGVGLGKVAARTDIHTGATAIYLRPSWAYLAARGRELLESPPVREQVRLRVAPSLVVRGAEAVWLGHGNSEQEMLHMEQAGVDEVMAAVLSAAGTWTPWSEVRRALVGTGEEGGTEALDEYLLVLVDQGILHHDLLPPLVGPPPGVWMGDRLAELSGAAAAATEPMREHLAVMARACARGDVAGARSLAALHGGRGSSLHAVLVHATAPVFTVSGRAVRRAALLAPLLFRLQQAMAPPVSERLLDTALRERLLAVNEIFGAGALDAGALIAGGYGWALGDCADGREASAAAAHGGTPAPVLTLLLDAVLNAVHARSEDAILDVAALDAALPAMEAPPSFELFLAPAREPPRRAPGTGWLLGLHAPAGASLGRFVQALGEPLHETLSQIAALEDAARPGEQGADIVYVASPETADLCSHPPVRAAALALTGWPDERTGQKAFGIDGIELFIDPAAPEPLGLRIGGKPTRPSPWHRVRSTTAPGGVYRLLAGWSFARQHAPWALTWGPLVELSFLPRVVVGGFVVAPASWKIPTARELGRRGALAAWRRRWRVPRTVQVGEGDELMLVDLAGKGAVRELVRYEGTRAWQIWPPLATLADRGGRRIEIVAAVVEDPGEETRAARATAIGYVARAGAVPPPAQQPAAVGWTTLKIYGAGDRQDIVLGEAVAPVVAAARAAGEIDSWFFLRYIDGPGGRDHLRVRFHTALPTARMAVLGRFEAAMEPLRASGDVVTVDTAGYHREIARYGGASVMELAEKIFQVDSDLVLRLLAGERDSPDPDGVDRRELAARAFDALASGWGLDETARRALAGRRRAAFTAAGDGDGTAREDLARVYRGLSARLQGALAGVRQDIFSQPLATANRETAACAQGRSPAEIARLADALPAILHLTAVRLHGPNAADEEAAFIFWERALEGLLARRGKRTP